jgi:hypothetical protein
LGRFHARRRGGSIATGCRRHVVDKTSGRAEGGISSIPKSRPLHLFSTEDGLFGPNPPGSAVDHFIAQAAMLLRGSRGGGFFTTIGRQKE